MTGAKLFKNRMLVALLASVGMMACLPLAAQTGKGLSLDPGDQPGFTANNVFHVADLDAINLYNGNLTIPLALGPKYPVANDLSYQLILVYNARPWEFGHFDGGSPGFWDMVEQGIPNLGLGWRLSPGQITQRPSCNAGNITGYYLDAYVSADGGRHQIAPQPDGNWYTTDGTRLKFSAVAGGYQMTDPDGRVYLFTHYVSPTGITDNDCANQGIYHDFGVGLDGYYLQSITSAKDSNSSIVFKYNSAIPWLLQYVDLPGQSAAVTVATSGSPVALISQITFTVSGGSTAIYSLQHSSSQWSRPYLSANSGTSTPTIAFLDTITLPTSDTYQFTYFKLTSQTQPPLSIDLWQAALQTMTVPTGATINYQYNYYPFYHHNKNKYETWCPVPGAASESVHRLRAELAPAGDCSPTYDPTVFGVISRAVSGSGADGSTTYSHYSLPCGEKVAAIGNTCVGGKRSEAITVVALPPNADGVQIWEKHRFYDAAGGGAPDGWVGGEIESATFSSNPLAGYSFSVPICGSASDGSGDQALCASKAARVATTDYDTGNPNTGGTLCPPTLGLADRRVNSQKTFYGPWARDFARPSTTPHVDIAWSGYDESTACYAGGSDQYRTRSVTSYLGGSTASRTETTNWTADTTRWLLNLFSYKSVDDGTSTSLTNYTFDATRGGVLTSVANSDSTQGKVTHNSSFVSGNPTSENFLSLGSGLDGKTYTRTNSFSARGQLLTSFWGSLPWKAYHVDRDSVTGWVTASYDANPDLVTRYSYDAIGRLTKIAPPGEAANYVCYDSATQTTIYRASSMLTCPVTSTTSGVLTWQQYLYDGLGRLVKERRLMPDNSMSMRVTQYDAAGHTSSVSEWVADSSSAPTQKTTYSGFDPFGRAQTVTKADGTKTTFSFQDGSGRFLDTQKAVTVCINGSGASCNGGTPATTTYFYDAFNHLTSVSEPDGNSTTYSYDILDNLSGVAQGSQTRTFTYDALGDLRTEMTPEKGTISFTKYDALGNLIEQTQHDLDPSQSILRKVTRSLDDAGRLLTLTSDQPQSGPTALTRTYLTNTYDNVQASYGRLSSSDSKTYANVGTESATTSLTYDSGTGRIAARVLTLPGQGSLETDWSYNTLGLVSQIRQLSGTTQTGLISYDYSNGYPTTVNGQPGIITTSRLVTNATYHPYGGLASIPMGNGNTTTIGADPNGLPRPSQIKTSGTSFDSGTYTYDGAGNITAIGSNTSYQYDLLSRLQKATVNGATQGLCDNAPTHNYNYCYDRWGNLTGKGNQTFAIDTTTNRLVSSSVVSYDGLGNQTKYGGQMLTFDALSRQTDYADGNGTESYVYDGEGERVARYGIGPKAADLKITNVNASYCPEALPTTIELQAVGGYGPPEYPAYTWTVTGLPAWITFDNTNRLTINAPSAPSSVTLSLTVRDAAGMTAPGSLTITVSTACTGTGKGIVNWYVQPQDAVICPGQSVTLAAWATNTNGSTIYSVDYHWFDGSGNEIPNPQTPGTIVPCGGTPPFQPGSCLTVTPKATPTQYYVTIFSQNADPATSRRATVWIGGPIQFQAHTGLICAGQGFSLSSMIDRALGCNLTISWQVQNPDGSWSTLGGDYVQPSQTTHYQVTVHADSPSQTLTYPVELDVLPQPVLTQVPASQSFCAGSSVTVTATANTQGRFRWDWWNPAISDWQGSWSTSYSLTSDTRAFSDAGDYRVMISTYCGVATSYFTLTQEGVPTIVPTSQNPPTSLPATITICPPQALTYNATVTGATSLQWQQLIGGVWTTVADVTPGGNLALNKTATQSSTYPGGDANHAVDGNTSGQWGDGSVTATQADAHAWWQVDLGASASIQTVQLWNRLDCCSDRLSAFYLFVSDAPFTSTDLAGTLAQTGVWSYYTPGTAGPVTAITVNRTGRYVRVQLSGTNYLSLAEVQVFGISSATYASYTTPVMTNPGTYYYRLAATNSCGTSYATSTVTVFTAPSPWITGPCSIAAGETATLVCNTNLGGSFSWQPGGQTTQSIQVSPTSTTTYTCSVGASYLGWGGYTYTCYGSASYTVAVATHIDPPLITAQPQSALICSGMNGSVSVTATGTNVAYQWQVQGGGGSWSNISGATAASYSCPSSNANYRVIVSNGCGSVTSSVASITVDPSLQPATITSQPQSTVACVSGSATLSVGATGTSVWYSWESSTDGTFWTPLGVSSSTLTVSPSASTRYRVRVGNSCRTVVSNVAWISFESPVTITTQPFGGTACGTQYWLQVAANGDAYQWQVWNGSTWANIAGATSTLYMATASGTYRVVVSNACGSVASNNAAVSLTPPPTQPVIGGDSFIYYGDTAHLYIASGCTGSYYGDGCSGVTWSDGENYWSIDVTPDSTTDYTVYGYRWLGPPVGWCYSPTSAPFRVTVGYGGYYYGGYGPAQQGPGNIAHPAGEIATAAKVITLAHGGPDKKANKLISVALAAGQRVIAGDWDGDGVASLGIYDPATGTFQLWNDDPKGKPDYQFAFGPTGAALQPIAGDWDGDGIDTVGVFDPLSGKMWLRNQNKAGSADVGFLFKLPIKNGIAVVGDWTSKGYDSVGVYDPVTSVFYLKDTNKSGAADHAVKVDPKGPGGLPLAGDWNDTGFSKVGLYDPASGEVRLRTTLTSGAAQYTRTFVSGLEQVFTGRWNATKHAPGGKPKVKRGSKPAVGVDFDEGSLGNASQVRLNLVPAHSRSLRSAASASAYMQPLAMQASTVTWNYTIRDENNRPSIQYHIGPQSVLIYDRLYAYLGDRLVATYEFHPQNAQPGWVYHAADHLGSIRLEGTTDPSDKIHNYWPFGEEVSQTANPNSLAHRFAGMERDAASSNDYDHARYHSAVPGRFLSPDTAQGKALNPQSWNRFSYALNNPLKNVDPNGLEPFSAHSVAKAFYSAAAKLEGLGPKFSPAYALKGVAAGLRTVGATLDLYTRSGEAIGSKASTGKIVSALANDTVMAIGIFTLANAAAPSATTATSTTTIEVSASRFGQAAEHISEAQEAGQPSTLTIGRAGANARRAEAMKGTDPVPGLDRDEYPPAMFEEGGAGSSVKAIDRSANRGCGAFVGNQCRQLPDGSQVEIRVTR